MRAAWRLPILAIGLVAVASCGGGEVGSSTTVAEAPTTSSSVTTSTFPQDATNTSSALSGTTKSLLVVGDWGTGTAPEGAVAGAMQRYAEQHEIASILTTGDNLLSDDAEFIMHPYGWVEESGLVWWITWGNHDVETDARVEQINVTFHNPPRWTVLRWGEVQVVILDSNQADDDEQTEFLQTTLADSGDPAIVVFHHPAVSCATSDSPTEEAFSPWLDEEVFLLLHGHEHNYQRFESDGLTTIITGGGGSPISPLDDCPSVGPLRAAAAELHHFLALTQENGMVLVQAIDVNGAVFDETTLTLP